MSLNNKNSVNSLFDINNETILENISMYFYTMYQRQEIWYNKNILKTDKPWCEYDVLNDYKFCNVYRELDKTSQWLIHNVICDESLSIKNRLWKVMILRLFNNVEYYNIGIIPNYEDYDEKDLYEQISFIEHEYFSVCNKKAFAINSFISKGLKQSESVTKYIIPSLYTLFNEIYEYTFVKKDIKKLVNLMKNIYGIGGFVSHEFFLDMTYFTKYTEQSCLYSSEEYVNVGPGCIGGLKTLYKDKTKYINQLHNLNNLSKELLPKDFKYIKWNKDSKGYELCNFNLNISIQEFWCCEWFKILKIQNKIGKQRDLYK